MTLGTGFQMGTGVLNFDHIPLSVRSFQMLDPVTAFSIGAIQGEATGLAEGYSLVPAADEVDDLFEVGLATGLARTEPPTPLQFSEGFALGAALGGAVAAAPTLSNITPDPLEDPGSPGAFSIDFRTALRTPITFDVGGIGTSALTIEVSFADRNERYVVLSVDGTFCWPFDVPSNNSLVGDHVTLLPRGGWPPTVVRLLIATSTEAT